MTSQRARAAAAAPWAALGLAASAIFLALPDKTFVFDGVMFAWIVERRAGEWRRELLNPRHLLFNPFFMLLRDALHSVGLAVDGYRLFQIVNALVGAAGLLLFGGLCRRLSRDAAIGWCAALLLGATWCYGTRATEGQTYMLMSFGALVVLWACARLIETPTRGCAVALSAAFSVAVLFHAADGVLLPAVAAALWLALPDRRVAAVAGAAALLAPLAAYLLVFRNLGLHGFIAKTADLDPSSSAAAWGLFSPLRHGLLLVWTRTGIALAPMPARAAAAAGLALWAAAGAAAYAAWPALDAPRRKAAAVLALAWAGFAALDCVWPGGVFFYVPHLACAFALLALAAGARVGLLGAAGRRRALGAAAAAGLALGAWNVGENLVPQSRIENNAGYAAAMYVGAHTLSSSIVVISGFGFPNSKVYIPFFARRRREVLEYYFDRQPKDAALKQLAEFSSAMTEHGVPLYFLSDLVDDDAVYREFARRWGVSRDEIDGALGPGAFMPVAFSAAEKIYLFVPAERRPELAATLAFRLFVEPSMTLTVETARALEGIVGLMGPAEKRRAIELIRRTHWGFDAYWSNLGPLQGPGWQEHVAPAARDFADDQKTSNFWLRAGNLDRMLGLRADALQDYERAQSISPDPVISRQVEALRRTR